MFIFTWNNPSEMPSFPEDTTWVACEEVGDSGTKHYQGYVRFKKNQRITSLKKLIPNAHWENRRGKHERAYDYCIKGTEVPYETDLWFVKDKVTHYYLRDGIPIEGSNMTRDELHQGSRDELPFYAEIIRAHRCWNDVVNDPQLFAINCKSSKWVKQIFDHKPRASRVFTPMTTWQRELLELVHTDPDGRTIHWYWSTDGKAGKTETAKYLAHHYGALYLSGGKTADIAYAIDNQSIIIFGYTRSHENFVNYDAMESACDGIIFSSKYQSAAKVFPPPHVIVFANHPPDETKCSGDRWKITEVFPLVIQQQLDAAKLEQERYIDQLANECANQPLLDHDPVKDCLSNCSCKRCKNRCWREDLPNDFTKEEIKQLEMFGELK